MEISALVYVLLIIAFAKMLGEIVTRFNQPSIVGELLAGIILGPFVLGEIFSQLRPMYTDGFISDLADLGILLLMLYVGLEFSPKQIVSSSWTGGAIAVFGIALPFILGFIVSVAFVGIMPNPNGITLVFVAIAVSVTALPVTIRILKDMEVIHTKTAATITSAAIITDVSLLFMMGILLGKKGSLEALTAETVFFLAVGYLLFFIIAIITGRYFVPHLYKLLNRMRTGEAAFAIAIGMAILFAVLADQVGMQPFIGAFIAGMILREAGTQLRVWARVEEILSGVTLGFLAPIFFVLIGFTVDFKGVFFGDARMIAFFFAILAVAIVAKLVGSFLPAKLSGMSTDESMAIGSMMMCKGAMELIFAKIALDRGLIDQALFSVLILMAFVSTVLAPILFKHFFNKAACAGQICRDAALAPRSDEPDI
jgi:Kef-type K+ transport system membrane component KefB